MISKRVNIPESESGASWPDAADGLPDPKLAPEAALSRFLFFQGLSPEVREQVAGIIDWRTYGAGATIIAQDETDHDVCFLFSGQVQVLRSSRSGRDVHYDSIKSGNFFGELSILDDMPRSATVIARSECAVGKITGRQFLDLVATHEKPALVLLRRLAVIIRDANERIANLSLMNAEQRLCNELAGQVEADPGNLQRYRVYPVPTQLELAARAGVTRQTVARVLSKLNQENIIERRGRVLHIHDRKKLQDIALAGKQT
ncbi:MAG: Crp/Fnr family transcriptional regulator [Rhodospirillaceae bacterium]|nr:Crp/Fnr family transcriptional regulator [Rhodospirillaceae bacterium]MBT5242709.1 Crp/Fnr family transcriptional regulator [Rhodospirillaceae bacterium]MBT6241880.1 Crp/Fnr family transcriptional regulator [Rhodospirillaceae bacterium]MBT7138681.1 Crp/Fnr family transcriptional regulator [Rhodospirillaceae bacterium]